MSKLILIAGGGTGGHIYPGIAIARELQRLDADLRVEFVGTKSGLEVSIVPREGFKLHTLAGGKLNFSGQPFEKLKTLIKLPFGFLQALVLLLKDRPQAVLGVGGYASAPLVLMASLLKIPTALWEPNAHPGLANRWLSKYVKRCFLVFDEARHELRCSDVRVLGMPIRSELESVEKPGAHSGSFRILHYGGSQGSRAIGTVLSEMIIQGKNDFELSDIQVVHQTGKVDFQKFKEVYQGFESRVEVHDFLHDMKERYLWADLVICRGGASTLAEVAAFGLPMIVIPLGLADGHQVKNAEVLQKAGAAVMVPQKELTPQRLREEILKIKTNEKYRQSLSLNVRDFHQVRAAERIARALLTEQS